MTRSFSLLLSCEIHYLYALVCFNVSISKVGSKLLLVVYGRPVCCVLFDHNLFFSPTFLSAADNGSDVYLSTFGAVSIAELRLQVQSVNIKAFIQRM